MHTHTHTRAGGWAIVVEVSHPVFYDNTSLSHRSEALNQFVSESSGGKDDAVKWPVNTSVFVSMFVCIRIDGNLDVISKVFVQSKSWRGLRKRLDGRCVI